MARDPMMEGFTVAASTVAAMLYFFPPGIAMLVAGSTVRFAPYSYAFGLTSCVLCIAVGVHHDRTALWRLSGFGLVAYAAYLVAFVRNSEHDDRRRRYLLRYVAGGCAAVLLVGAGLGNFGSDAAFDDFCSTVACLASLAPLWNVWYPAVFRTRSTDSMPSVIVAALGLTNAIVSTARNTAGAGDIDRNIAIPSVVALLSTLVQVVLHVGCWCLPRPLRAPPAVDDTPLLQNQNEDGGSGHEHDPSATADGRQSPNEDNARETRMDVATLEELAIKNLTLPENGHHGLEEVAVHNVNVDEIVDSSNLQLPQHGQRSLEEVTDHNDDEIVDSSNFQLPQDGQRGLEEVTDHKIVDSSNHQLPQDGQEDISHPK